MAISDQLTQLNTIKQSIKTAINNKGGSVGNNFSTYAAAIAALPTTHAASEITYGKADVVTIKPFDSTVKIIGDRDFQSWQHPIGLVIESGLETIDTYAFFNWINAETLTLPNSITRIKDFAFSQWAKLKVLSIPPNLIEVGASAFQGCTIATGKIIIPNSVTILGAWAFNGCAAVTEVSIGSGVSSIGTSTFSGLTSCLKISLPSTITSINASSFQNLTSCTEFICLATTPPNLVSNALNGLNASCVIKVPEASLAAYKSATNWSAHASKMAGI